jgi:hypothetical protein
MEGREKRGERNKTNQIIMIKKKISETYFIKLFEIKKWQRHIYKIILCVFENEISIRATVH